MSKESETKLNPEKEFDLKRKYEQEKEELAQLVDKTSIIMCEHYLENNFLITQWQYYDGLITQNDEKLKRTPMDIGLLAKKKKLENDREIFKKAALNVNAYILTHLEVKYGEGKQFQHAKTIRSLTENQQLR